MPSYNLVKNMNLGDVECTTKARDNLRIGPFVHQNSNNVLITGGTITVDTLVVNKNFPEHEPTPGLKDSYVVSGDNTGTLDWSHYFPLVDWALDYASNIPLSSFSNDVLFVESQSMCNISFFGRYSDLENEPTLEQVIPESEKQLLLRADCNLEEFLDADGKFNNTFRNHFSNLVGLKSLAFKTYENTTIRDVTVHNLFMFGNCNQIDSLLQSKSYVSKDGIFNTVNTDWYNPFYDIYTKEPRDIMILIDSYSNQSKTSSTTSRSLSNMFVDLEQVIQTNQGNFDCNVVKNTMSNRMESGEFLFMVSNLSEPIIDLNECRQHLGLGNISTIQHDDTSHVLQVSSLSVSQSITHNNQVGNAESLLLYNCQDDTGTMVPIDTPNATNDSFGMVRLSSNLLSPIYDDHPDLMSSNFVVNSTTLSNFYRDTLSNIDHIASLAYSNAYEFDDVENYVFLDNELSQFVDNQKRKFDAYTNLNLSPICYNGGYYNLYAYPISLIAFDNDLEFILRNNNMSEFSQSEKQSCRSNLELGNMAEQFRNGVTISNGSANLKHVMVKNMQFLNLSTGLFSPSNSWIACSKNNDNEFTSSTAHLSRLSEANETMRGLVKLVDSYKVASYDSVVPAEIIENMYNELISRLNDIETKLNLLPT